MATVDEILAGSPLSALRRISHRGGDRKVTAVRLAERFAELDAAPADSFVVLARAASAEVTGYRLDMALRWAAQGSVVKTADRLHLHRNAVTNRLRSITGLLDVDLDDPDQRLALQLACRAWLLG